MKILLFLLFPCLIFSREVINGVSYNLDYTPWYTGSLLSLSGQTVPKGVVEIQPYLFVLTQYGQYDDHFSFSSTQNVVNVIPQFIFYYGFTKNLDMQLIVETVSRFQGSESSTRFADTSLLFGFQVLRETPKLPFIRFTVNEIFPTGKHDQLNISKNKTDLSGQGSFITELGLNLEKLYDWVPSHPIKFRVNLSLNVSSKSKIKGLSFWGGSENTKGTVKPGLNYFVLFSPEISLTQKWAFTTDLVYQHSFKSSFSGRQGTIHEEQAVLNLGVQDSLQFAPAIEYNFSPNLGIIFGTWFSIIGRNTNAFISGVISFVGNF